MALALALLASSVAANPYAYPGDAPYDVSANQLSSVLECPYGPPSNASKTVLLVHGTGSNANESWGTGYLPALHSDGYQVCQITLPDRALDDAQTNAEYVAYNIHQTSDMAGGGPVSVLSHSLGNDLTQWALRFWPSLHKVTSSYIGLDPTFAGIGLEGVDKVCEVGKLGVRVCAAALWQQLAGSHFLQALHSPKGRGFHALVPTSIIWTRSDGIVLPPGKNAQLPDASVHSVQELCPGRLVNHFTMLVDAAGYAMARDALSHGGRLDMKRVKADRTPCSMSAAPGMKASLATTAGAIFNALVPGVLLGPGKVDKEPPLKPYAQDVGTTGS